MLPIWRKTYDRHIGKIRRREQKQAAQLKKKYKEMIPQMKKYKSKKALKR